MDGEAAPALDSALLEFMYACPVGLVEIDQTGTIVMINPHAMKHLLPIAAASGREMVNLFVVLEACAPELRNLFELSAPARGVICDSHRIIVDLQRGVAGVRKVLSCTMVRLDERRGIATFTDVSKQVEQERRLKLAEAWFSSLLDGVIDYAVLTITSDGRVETVDEAFVRQTGRACGDVKGCPLSAVLDQNAEPGSPSMSEQLRLAHADGWALDESWQQRVSGDRYWCQRLIVARVGEDGETVDGYTVVLRDVAHRANDANDLRRRLTEDHLTGAANRSYFLQRFEIAQRLCQKNHKPVSLLLLDLDHFKSINDRYGHPVGDDVLRRVSTVCMSLMRPGCLFSRLGGEEFAALLPNVGLADALSIAERLRAAIETIPMVAAGFEFSITASFGCASTQERAIDIDAMIKTADERLYDAKRSGRNRICGPEAPAVMA